MTKFIFLYIIMNLFDLPDELILLILKRCQISNPKTTLKILEMLKWNIINEDQPHISYKISKNKNYNYIDCQLNVLLRNWCEHISPYSSDDEDNNEYESKCIYNTKIRCIKCSEYTTCPDLNRKETIIYLCRRCKIRYVVCCVDTQTKTLKLCRLYSIIFNYRHKIKNLIKNHCEFPSKFIATPIIHTYIDRINRFKYIIGNHKICSQWKCNTCNKVYEISEENDREL